MAEAAPWYKPFTWFYEVWNLAQFIAATGLAARADRVTGLDWSTPTPWMLTAFYFAIGIAGVRVLRSVVEWLHTWFNKPNPVVDVESSGTDKPVLEIAHFGAPAIFWAEGRITKVLSGDGVVKPSRNRFACELQPAEGKPFGQRVMLRDGEWAHIVLADIVETKPDGRRWLRIRRGSYHKGSLADDSGVEIEIVVKTSVKSRIGDMRRLVRITRNGNSIAAVVVDN